MIFMKFLSFSILLFFCGSIMNNIMSQVTIGSTQMPVEGALLDLTEGTTTKKGLLLPRVELSDINKLKMGDNDLTGQETLHTGLLVYSSVESQSCQSGKSILKGIYVWTGTNWEALMSSQTIFEVMTFKDQDGNNFLAREFGDAGIWMIENLRAKKFDPIRDGTDAREIDLRGPMFFNEGTNGGTELYPALWMYPMAEGASEADDRLFMENPSLGLLYTRGATDRGLEDNMAEDSLNHERRQGICPSGWHLPSIKEWAELENEMLEHTSIYSSTPDIGGTPILADDYERSPSLPYIDKCTTFDSRNGTSFIKEFGGFSALLAGVIGGETAMEFGKSFQFATSTRHHYMSYSIIWNYEFGTDFIQKGTTYSSQFVSVRCKKN